MVQIHFIAIKLVCNLGETETKPIERLTRMFTSAEGWSDKPGREAPKLSSFYVSTTKTKATT